MTISQAQLALFVDDIMLITKNKNAKLADIQQQRQLNRTSVAHT